MIFIIWILLVAQSVALRLLSQPCEFHVRAALCAVRLVELVEPIGIEPMT
jgi:hypothetical protein